MPSNKLAARVSGVKQGSRQKLSELAPRLLEMRISEITALFGTAPRAFWHFDEADVSGTAQDISGNGFHMTAAGVPTGIKAPGPWGDRQAYGQVGSSTWQRTPATDLEPGTQDFIVAGIAQFNGPVSVLNSWGGKAVGAPNNGWDILTFTDGRFQFDIWVAGSQKPANTGKDHRGGPFAFFCGRIALRNGGASLVITSSGGQSTGLAAAGDLTNAAAMTLTGQVPVAVSGPMGVSSAGIWIGADLSAMYDNRAAILAGMMR